MDWQNYINSFEEVLNGTNTAAPYNDPSYVEYVRLNHSRMKRWAKRGVINAATKTTIANIDSPQKWILITEAWCGDAAHVAPFIQKMCELNPMIELEIQLRDSENSEIESYLTNGGKAMPKLIVRDENDQDLFTWGPRTEDSTRFIQQQNLSDLTVEAKKAEQQLWYNTNQGVSLQKEIADLVQNSTRKSMVA